MLTKAEKLDSVKKKLNEASAEESWGVQFMTDQIANKLDSLLKKAKRLYAKFCKNATAPGSWMSSIARSSWRFMYSVR